MEKFPTYIWHDQTDEEGLSRRTKCVCVCVCVCWGNKCITQLQNMTCIFGRLPVRVTVLNV